MALNSTNQTLIGKLSYLNQTNTVLVSGSSVLSFLINYPHRIWSSFKDAIVAEYHSAVNPVNLSANGTLFVQELGYFFSNYAISCLTTAIILNRVLAMSSLRSNTRRTTLPLWSRLFLHSVAIGSLLYGLFHTALEFDLIQGYTRLEMPAFLKCVYFIISLSQCVEAFITTTTNSKPLGESDFTLFELSMCFYSLSISRDATIPKEYLLICFMALLAQLNIHVVEIVRKRKYRLFLSTLLNIPYLTYLCSAVYSGEIESLPFIIRFSCFPKLFALFCIIVSVVCYLLACIVRFNPWGKDTSSPRELQYYSFMRRWWANLSCTGEEEFTVVLMKLAILLCNSVNSQESGIHRELSALKHPKQVHKSYLISGYLNKVATAPEDSSEKDQSQYREDQSKLSKQMECTRSLAISFYQMLKRILISKPTEAINRDFLEGASKKKNFNDYVTEKNYSKFLRVGDPKSLSGKLLLPDQDFSEDYILSDEETNTDYEEEECDEDFDDQELQSTNVLSELIAPDQFVNDLDSSNLGWFLSMCSILKHELSYGKRLTRSQYAQLNEAGLLQEVMLSNAHTLNGSKQQSSLPKGDNEEELDMNCVVCKTSVRNIVLWPCRCFALCEDCRVSLGMRGFNTCVCCREKVHGYSKVNTV